ncbi:MAG: hypothetical protein IPF98_10495 [Gemmatimonadetes bacterium]|nr:hypothetical protein [Gemmatimonadota bacterium]MCC6772473.1 hypothetical protein [Gemmatimonadaceae bacterium]
MSMYRQILAVCAALASASPLAAQQAGATSLVKAPTSVAVMQTPALAPAVAPDVTRPVQGPTASSSVAGVRVHADAATPAPAVVVQSVGRNPALMIVGGTALVVGAVIGGQPGTIVMVGGGVVGLLGLWRYLQ